jgi:hypothetical protein
MMLSQKLAGLLNAASVSGPLTCRNCRAVESMAYGELSIEVEKQSAEELSQRVAQFVSDPNTTLADLSSAYIEIDRALDSVRAETDRINKIGGRAGFLHPLYGVYAWILSESTSTQQTVLENAKKQIMEALAKKLLEEEEKRRKPNDPLQDNDPFQDTNDLRE